MRKIPLVLTAAASFALAAGVAKAQQSWGPKHTTYWNSDATGKYAQRQFITSTVPTMSPPAAEVQMQAPARQQRMYYQPAAKRMRAPMRVRQRQPNMRPGQPPAERGEQPPADAKPSAPPAQDQPPMQNQQPGQAPT